LKYEKGKRTFAPRPPSLQLTVVGRGIFNTERTMMDGVIDIGVDR